MAILTLRDVSLAFGGPKLLDGADFAIERSERVCLLGRNGEGKSTLLRLIAGELEPDHGEVIRQQGLRVARLPQDVPREWQGRVAEVVASGRAVDGHDPAPAHEVEAVLSRVGLDPDADVQALSSGMKRRVLLARAIVAEPDLLLLDEPTNHLDIGSIRWLEDFLARWGGSLVFVTHDRAFLGRLATRIVELDRGHLHDWECDYPTFLKRREEQLSAESRQNELFDRKLAQEETWIRKGVEARRTRNEGRVRALEELRRERARRRERQGTARVEMQEAERSGTRVIEARGVSFGYGEREVIRDFSTQIERGEKVGIIGPNGAGKTTLLRLILGLLPPSSGSLKHGTNLEIAYLDQLRATLDEERTVQQNLSEYDTILVNGRSRHVLGYLQDFLFAPERSRSLVKYLSGGERSRLLLARLFTRPSNVLVLDEPTNDLDIETLELLESLLVEYAGTVLLVSHDRAFLNEVATSTLAVEADGRVRETDGGYDEYERVRDRETEERAAASQAVRREGPTEGATAATTKPRKRSYKEQRELEGLPQRIEDLEAESAALHAEMADPAFYRRGGDEIARSRARLEAIENEMAEVFERWEALEALGGS
jgi:ATP-binding cassette subfamily F protein uup